MVAGFQFPSLYFMVRGDIFKWWLKPITWAAQMFPIYRLAEDGADSIKRNSEVYLELRKVLKRKKSILLFGEGYTDNEFIRSLKPLKKGAARIGFEVITASDWKLDVKIQPLGLNYTHPKHLRSECLLCASEIIHLKDYRDAYEENPNMAITQLTREIEKGIQKSITYVENKELAPFVENLMILNRKGMNHFHYDKKYSLREKFEYSRKLADTVNKDFDVEPNKWRQLKANCESYFKELENNNINDDSVLHYSQHNNNKKLGVGIRLILSSPILLFGLVHSLIPYLLIKKFVESTFKRDVFWSGVKMLLGATAWTLFNLPVIWIFHSFIYPSFWLGFLYFIVVIPITFVISYNWFKDLKSLIQLKKSPVEKLKSLSNKRKGVLDEMNALGL
jgi:hypothetical protein